ncbi:MAG TPA: hypothetical protein VF846_10475, partial [Thermoanaerobaculia bacterium]
YVMCWGEGASRFEDLVDEAAVMKHLVDPARPTIMTTAHEGEPLADALEFATTVAIPAEAFPKACRDVVLLFHGHVGWYNEAQNVLEDMLRDV